MESVRAAAVQMQSVVGDAGTNGSRMEEFVRTAAAGDADLVCFPECSLTGYSSSFPEDLTLDLDSPEVMRFSDMSEELSISVCLGLAERTDGRPYDTQVLFSSGGRMVYRKTHLGLTERGTFSRGDLIPVADIGKAVVGTQLCWESHIPDISTVLRRKGCEVALIPYATGMPGGMRVRSWGRFLPARASDNGMYVIACNAVGPNGAGGEFGGGIAAYGPREETLHESSQGGDRMVFLDLDGDLPRYGTDGMHDISYFDRRRPELYG